ncbi:hypothetical protein Goarm_003475 [Gossypium armourianum]|uniref:Uncharacterized protein n=1 Tax=Gossypium armourianum TaxID=34283 RepID=A0A7J9K3A7_9ROSI|nr:hypothetical protein [Gossypium armourianum]
MQVTNVFNLKVIEGQNRVLSGVLILRILAFEILSSCLIKLFREERMLQWAAKILANLIVMGSGILARAVVQAYRQALSRFVCYFCLLVAVVLCGANGLSSFFNRSAFYIEVAVVVALAILECGITPLNTSELIVFDVDLLTVMSSLKKSHEENWFRINILLLILTNNSKVVYSRVCFIRINLLNSKFVVDAAKSGVTHETLQNAVRRGGKVMTEQEARLILGKYEILFEKNAKNGSFYLQSKVHRAKECLESVYQGKAEGSPPS